MEIAILSQSREIAQGSSVFLNQQGKVLVWGRNDMATVQQMGLHLIVKDPTGAVVIDRTEWELWPHTSPGDAHGFIGPTFNFDKEGMWRVELELLMGYPNAIVVDTYMGDLCSVTGAYAGTITVKQLEYDGVREDIPVY